MAAQIDSSYRKVSKKLKQRRVIRETLSINLAGHKAQQWSTVHNEPLVKVSKTNHAKFASGMGNAAPSFDQICIITITF